MPTTNKGNCFAGVACCRQPAALPSHRHRHPVRHSQWRDRSQVAWPLTHLPGSSTCCGWNSPDCAVDADVTAVAGRPRSASALPMKKVPPSRLCTSASLAISLVDNSSTSASSETKYEKWLMLMVNGEWKTENGKCGKCLYTIRSLDKDISPTSGTF